MMCCFVFVEKSIGFGKEKKAALFIGLSLSGGGFKPNKETLTEYREGENRRELDVDDIPGIQSGPGTEFI